MDPMLTCALPCDAAMRWCCAGPGAKNVLFLVVDDLRNELGFTNKRDGIITPNLDALVSTGVSGGDGLSPSILSIRR